MLAKRDGSGRKLLLMLQHELLPFFHQLLPILLRLVHTNREIFHSIKHELLELRWKFMNSCALSFSERKFR